MPTGLLLSAGTRAAIAFLMRTVSAVLACVALSSSGCSTLVAGRGVRLHELTTRAMVHETLGEPTEVQAIAGKLREVYSTRRKVTDTGRVLGYFIFNVYTAGLAEVVFLPYELGKAGYHNLKGQRVEFTYDDAFTVTQVTYNGMYPVPRYGGGHSFAEIPPNQADTGSPRNYRPFAPRTSISKTSVAFGGMSGGLPPGP